jgi:hypothetical protein
MRAAVIENGVVTNVIEVESLDVFPGLVDGTDAEIGDAWDGTTFTHPAPAPPAVPASVTMRQARLALLAAGKLETVNSAIASMAGAEGDVARIEWEYAREVRRDSPLMASMMPVLGMTDAEIDALFVTAESL